jgi:hypothetical protein
LEYDTLLTNALNAVSSRFDKETNRTLARSINFTQEFDATDTTCEPPTPKLTMPRRKR